MSETPQTSWFTSPRARTPPRSVQSPILTRTEEKDQLSYLNDKLVIWKDKNTTVRQQNDDLRRQLEEARAAGQRELDALRNMYEQELADARRLLDETAKEKAKNQITATKNAALANDLRGKLASETEAREKADGALKAAEQALVRKEGQIQNAQKEARDSEKARREAEREADEVRAALERAKNDLDAETVNRVDAENNLQSMKEDLTFKTQLFDQERGELLARLDASERSRADLKKHFDEQLEKKVMEALQDAREQHVEELEQLRDELERQYEDQIQQLKDRQERDKQLLDKILAENHDMRDANQALKGENAAALAKKGEMEKRVADLAQALKQERENHADDKDRLERELAAALGELEDRRKEYAELMEANVRLDKEIEKYAKLLEEPLLKKTSPTQTPGSVMASGRGRKRRRGDVPEDHETCIIISELDPDGNFVTLSNANATNESIGNWHLRHEAPGMEPIDYKFPARTVLKGQSHITVWTAGSGHGHRPPRDLLFKQRQSWGVADESSVFLLTDTSGSVKASSSFPGQSQASGAGTDAPDSGPPASDGQSSQEDIFHQQGDPQKEKPEKPEQPNCVIC